MPSGPSGPFGQAASQPSASAVAEPTVDVAAASDAGGSAKRPPLPCETRRQCADRLGYGNVCVDKRCERYLDRTDILETFGLSSAQPTPRRYKLYPAIFPAIGYAPSLGFVFGALRNFGMYLGQPETTVMSSASIFAMYTTENQLIIQLESTLLTEGNNWELQSDWRFRISNNGIFLAGWSFSTQRRLAAPTMTCPHSTSTPRARTYSTGSSPPEASGDASW